MAGSPTVVDAVTSAARWPGASGTSNVRAPRPAQRQLFAPLSRLQRKRLSTGALRRRIGTGGPGAAAAATNVPERAPTTQNASGSGKRDSSRKNTDGGVVSHGAPRDEVGQCSPRRHERDRLDATLRNRAARVFVAADDERAERPPATSMSIGAAGRDRARSGSRTDPARCPSIIQPPATAARAAGRDSARPAATAASRAADRFVPAAPVNRRPERPRPAHLRGQGAWLQQPRRRRSEARQRARSTASRRSRASCAGAATSTADAVQIPDDGRGQHRGRGEHGDRRGQRSVRDREARASPRSSG